MGGTTQAVIGAGQGLLGGGIGLWATLRFVRWAIEFTCKRLDVRAAALREREKDLEKRYDNRLRHLEIDLARTQRAATMLLNWVAANHPSSPVLQRAAELLAPTDPNIGGPLTDVPNSDDELEALVRKAKRRDES